MPELSIIIPAKNEEKYLPLLLKSIRKQTIDDLEIIIADANSTDHTKKIAKYYECNTVEGGIPSIARNNGARSASSNNLCFIDSDIILPNERYLETALNEFKERRLDFAGTKLSPIPTRDNFNNFLYKLFYGFTNICFSIQEKTNKPFMQSLMLADKQAFNAIGGYPNYIFGEDSALAENAIRHGYNFGILKKPENALISPRRLEKKGFLKMLAIYAYFNTGRILGHEFLPGKSGIKYFED